jgi:orc1/cdc6 family replication initiation protein
MYGHDPTSIIVEHDILREVYIPAKLKARETQIDQILCCLSPVIKNQKPIHIWLYGKPGTGKTTAAVHVLRHLEEKHSIRSIVINCWEKDTFYEILDKMISEFRILRADEHRTSFKLDKLCSFFKDRPFVVVLDEVDQVKPRELSSVLYNLDSMLNAGIVCISDSTRALMGLEERVRSRLNPHTIFFPCYSQQILLDILTHRAELALTEGSWTLTALRHITAMAQGDARAAIRILRRVAVMADHQRLDRITSKTLKERMKAIKDTRKVHVLNSLTQDHRILYEIVKQKGKILSGDFWEEYLQRCSLLRRRPLASRTFSDYANRLVQAGLMTSERARVRGKVRLFKVVA